MCVLHQKDILLFTSLYTDRISVLLEEPRWEHVPPFPCHPPPPPGHHPSTSLSTDRISVLLEEPRWELVPPFPCHRPPPPGHHPFTSLCIDRISVQLEESRWEHPPAHSSNPSHWHHPPSSTILSPTTILPLAPPSLSFIRQIDRQTDLYNRIITSPCFAVYNMIKRPLYAMQLEHQEVLYMILCLEY